MTIRTIGDESQCECPSCSKQISMQDIATDGCLVPGYEGMCEHCEAEFKIEDVDYSATVWLVPKKTGKD